MDQSRHATGQTKARHDNQSDATHDTSDPTVTYASRGPSRPGHSPVYVEVDGVETYELSRYRGVIAHSKGFGWGYAGSGPAQLALAILVETYDAETAREHYQALKRELIATQPGDERFELRESEVRQLVNEREGGAVGVPA